MAQNIIEYLREKGKELAAKGKNEGRQVNLMFDNGKVTIFEDYPRYLILDYERQEVLTAHHDKNKLELVAAYSAISIQDLIGFSSTGVGRMLWNTGDFMGEGRDENIFKRCGVCIGAC